MKTIPFFMRFYGRSDDEIKQCVAELQENGLTFVKYSIRDGSLSVNFEVPPVRRPFREVTIRFESLEKAKEMHSNETLQKIYHKWATKDPEGCSFELRKPKDFAFAV